MDTYRHYFTRAIQAHYPAQAAVLTNELLRNQAGIARDTQFVATSGNPIDKRLDFCAWFLALIKTLDERGEAFDTIRTICLDIVLDYVRPKNKLQQLLKRLPVLLMNTRLASVFLTIFQKRISRKSHPDGFVAQLITDKAQTFGLGYGVDIIECGICKLFSKHHYAHYAAILCEVDVITSRLAGLTLVRTGTIALGAPTCDFRFKKEP